MKYIKIQPTVLRTNNVVITVVGIGELKMKILSLKILQHKQEDKAPIKAPFRGDWGPL